MDVTLLGDRAVGHTYNPGYILLSYFVSFVGCWTALKLLHRRTSRHGYYNWYLLLGAAIAMGAVAIWSMHFIGNRAITMYNGERELQIRYSAGCTAGSFFLPIGVVSVAFYLLGLSEKVHISRIIVVGITTGAAVCGMHYLGQKGISNYNVSYEWRYVVGSAFIAIIAATIALGVFFYLKATWTNSWVRRATCAAILAAAVSGMHWVATVGTIYHYTGVTQTRRGLSRQATVVIVLCLAIGCCFTLISFAIIGQRLKTRSAHRASQVVLASVVFDTEDRLMVTSVGRLPSRKIAKTYLERTFGEVFDIDHPVFAWIYRASHHWSGLGGLIPQMKAHLRASKPHKPFGSTSSNELSDQMTLTSEEGEKNFGTTFKEHFCVAASELAEIMGEPLESLGVLFESVMSTGTVARQRKVPLIRHWPTSSPGDVERGNVHPMLGRGQVLFLIRRASPHDAARLQAHGFSFASLTNIIPSLAQSMQVDNSELTRQLHGIQRHLSEDYMLTPGIHLGCFAVRPRLHRGWEILVDKSKKNLLPSVALTEEGIRSHEMEMKIINAMDNFSIAECYLYLQDRKDKATNRDEAECLGTVHRGIDTLAAQVGPALFTHARLLARVFPVPCQNTAGCLTRAKAGLIVFRVMADAHYSNPFNGRCEFVSSRLFRAQQHVYPGSPDHGAFERQVHLEFAKLAEGQTSNPPSLGPSTPRRPSTATTATSPNRPDTADTAKGEKSCPLASNPSGSVASSSHPCKPSRAKKARALFGGIHVQRDISVNVSEVHDEETELKSLGVRSEVSLAPAEIDTFADELMVLLLDERRQQLREH
ncbi:MAG: hypothetical protein Q9202_004923 [Teloschistes flavicans]